MTERQVSFEEEQSWRTKREREIEERQRQLNNRLDRASLKQGIKMMKSYVCAVCGTKFDTILKGVNVCPEHSRL